MTVITFIINTVNTASLSTASCTVRFLKWRVFIFQNSEGKREETEEREKLMMQQWRKKWRTI